MQEPRTDNRHAPYTVILDGGYALPPSEDLTAAVIAAAQVRELGQMVSHILRGDVVILEGVSLKEAICWADAGMVYN